MLFISKLHQLKRVLKRRYYTFRVLQTAKFVKGAVRVNGPSSVTRNTSLGSNVHFNGMKICGGGTVVIGDNFHSGVECMMITDVHNYDKGKAIPYDDTYIVKDITIHDNVWLGSRVMILGGVTIGEGAIIQAGSVVVSDIPPCAIAGGHPAKVFRYRDKQHYSDLKEKKCFH